MFIRMVIFSRGKLLLRRVHAIWDLLGLLGIFVFVPVNTLNTVKEVGNLDIKPVTHLRQMYS